MKRQCWTCFSLLVAESSGWMHKYLGWGYRPAASVGPGQVLQDLISSEQVGDAADSGVPTSHK